MEVLKRLAPNYWAGYYAVYVAMNVYLTFVFYDALRKWPEIESLFVAAAIFAVSAGAALLSAIITEGIGYVVLLIPRRIRQIKKEGLDEGMKKGRAEGLAEGLQRGIERGLRKGRAEARGNALGALARYDRGEITLDQFRAILADLNNGDGESG